MFSHWTFVQVGGITQSVYRLRNGVDDRGVGFRFPVGTKFLIWDPSSLLHSKYQGLFPRGNSGGSVKLTIHLNPVLRLRMVQLYLYSRIRLHGAVLNLNNFAFWDVVLPLPRQWSQNSRLIASSFPIYESRKENNRTVDMFVTMWPILELHCSVFWRDRRHIKRSSVEIFFCKRRQKERHVTIFQRVSIFFHSLLPKCVTWEHLKMAQIWVTFGSKWSIEIVWCRSHLL
jgi:hypothetical protein